MTPAWFLGRRVALSSVSYQTYRSIRRCMASMAGQKKGVLLGLYEAEKDGDITLTKAAQGFQTSKTQKLTELIQLSGLAQKKGKCRVFYGLDPEYSSVAVVSLGKKGVGYNELEEYDEGRENIRAGVAAGVKQLQEAGVKAIDVDPCGDPEAVAEAAHLCLHCYDELKASDKRKTKPELTCLTTFVEDTSSVNSSWQRGVYLAEGQNLARRLMEAPANYMTPTRFAEIASETIGKLDKCQVTVRDRAWAEEMKMGSYLSVTNGSEEPPKFVEISYKGAGEDDAPFAIVGKGITFDSGGISLKPPANMDLMRADMGGAACTVGSIYAAAKLNIPINIKGFIPLAENMPGRKATKPGDVVTAMNGKTIQVDNTDAEGRLVLADALCYAQTFNPSGIIDMATLTGAIGVALGSAATGVFSNDAQLWNILKKAGNRTGDRVWRMPLFKHYTKQVTECQLADLNNIGTAGRMGGSCTAAAFLREFVTHDRWMHLDIAGVIENKAEVPYLGKGMSGRPTRTVVEFLAQLSSKAKAD